MKQQKGLGRKESFNYLRTQSATGSLAHDPSKGIVRDRAYY